MHRLFLTILLIQKRRCGDSDLTPGLTGSSVGSLATRESAPQPPPASSILLLNPLPLLLLLIQSFFQNLLLFLSKRPACCQSPSFAKSLSPIYNLQCYIPLCWLPNCSTPCSPRPVFLLRRESRFDCKVRRMAGQIRWLQIPTPTGRHASKTGKRFQRWPRQALLNSNYLLASHF